MKVGARSTDIDDTAAILELSFNEAVRKLDLGLKDLEAMRSRAGTLVTTATATAAFLLGVSFDRGQATGRDWIVGAAAGLAYLTVIAVAMSASLPRRGWAVGQNTALLAAAAAGESLSEVYGRLATRYQEAFESNRRLADRIAWRIRIAVCALAAEVALLGAFLAVSDTVL